MKRCHTLDVLLALAAHNRHVDDLTAQLGTARKPVRAALTRLKNVGLAVVPDHSLWARLTTEGARVAQRELLARRRGDKLREKRRKQVETRRRT